MAISRRGFIGGAMAFGCLVGTASAAPSGGALRVGIVSDIHIANEGDSEVTLFREALEHFRERNVDVVVCGGDMADGGKYEQLELVRRIWDGVYPDGKGADGQPVERVFIYGNHDVASWGGRAGPTGIYHDQGGAWERCWREKWVPICLKRIKGVAFIGVHWGHESELPGFLAGRADELKGDRPFFIVQHPHPKGTCHGPFAGGTDDGASHEAMAAFPNAVVLSGHSHRTLTDEMAFWQGAFTSVGMGSLSYTALPRHRHAPFGYENTTITEVKGDRLVEGNKMMPLAPTRGHPFMVMTVEGSSVSFERLELADGRVLSLGRNWQASTPVGTKPPLTFSDRRGRETPPRFPEDYLPVVMRMTLPTRGYRGFNGWTIDEPVASRLKDAYVFDVPQTIGPDRAFELELAVETENGVVERRHVLVSGYDRSPDSPSARKPTRVILPCDQMPRQRFRFVVTPVTALGTRGCSVPTQWCEGSRG